jgi:hypothetical protein
MEASPSTPSALAGTALIDASTGLRPQMGMAVLLNGTPSRLPPSFPGCSITGPPGR